MSDVVWVALEISCDGDHEHPDRDPADIAYWAREDRCPGCRSWPFAVFESPERSQSVLRRGWDGFEWVPFRTMIGGHVFQYGATMLREDGGVSAFVLAETPLNSY